MVDPDANDKRSERMSVSKYDLLCYNCMEPLIAPETECRACHHDNRNRTGSRGCLSACLLQNQYFVGRKLGDGGFGITYIGYDLNLDRKVAIKEYFPRGTVLRDDDNVTVRPFADEDEENYRRGKQRMLEEASFIARNGSVPNVVHV